MLFETLGGIMSKLQVKNTCTVQTTLPLSYLNNMQGELKTLSDENYKKLKKSILKHGFFMPFFVWENQDDAKMYIIDGTQRLKALIKMRDEGYSIPQLPVVLIEADSKKEAKEKLLAAAGSYGVVDELGFKDFVLDLNIDDVFGFAALPKFDFNIVSNKSREFLSQETVTVSEHERKINEYKEAPLPDLTNADAPDFKQMTFIVHVDQLKEIERAISKAKNNEKFDNEKNENSNGNALYYMALKYNDKKS